MLKRIHLFCMVLAVAACDRVTSPSYRDAGPDSAASLWEQVDAGTVNYNAVAGSAPDNVFIVGDQGTILHWDGTALIPEASGTYANLRAVSVVNETLAYAVGEQGIVLRREAGYWIPEPQITTQILSAIYADPFVTIVAGEQGTILSRTAQVAMSAIPNTRTDNYYAISGAADGVHVVGALGVVVRLTPDLRAISATSTIPGYTKVIAAAVPYSSGSLFVGVDGAFFYWANEASSGVSVLPQRFLRGISLVGDTAWVVGHDGFVATGHPHAQFTIVPIPDDRWLLGVYAAAPDDVWVVGRSGLILRGPPGVRGVVDGGPP